MGSQFWFVARAKSKDVNPQQKAESDALEGFDDYLRKMTPHYAVNCATRHSHLSVLDREARFREGDLVAMHFYSESRMR
jgi:hypothetical protein